MIILIHTSKTMRPKGFGANLTIPEFIDDAKVLDKQLKNISAEDISNLMKISPDLANKTKLIIDKWSVKPSNQTCAIDTFVGDIYSGLQTANWDKDDRQYAQDNLRILSGLYGVLRPNDGVMPYRLEMGYTLVGNSYKNLYEFWGKKLAESLPKSGLIINVSADEYTKTILPYVDQNRVVTPRFLTISPKTNEPTFVVVHAKIARGAFANWLIKQKAKDNIDLTKFNNLGYSYSPKLSTKDQPVYVCQKFGGIGLSVRLK